MKRFRLALLLVGRAESVENAARDRQHLPAADRVFQPFLDHGQVKLLVGQLAVLGQRLQLLGQLAALFESLLQAVFRGGPALQATRRGAAPALGRGAFELLADGLLRAMAAEGRGDVPIESIALAPQRRRRGRPRPRGGETPARRARPTRGATAGGEASAG